MHDIKLRPARGVLAGLALIVALCLAATRVLAAYPDNVIKMIVPYPPGGATDVIGRVLATQLSTALGQQVVVENRGGAGGNLGAEAVARAPADGYTLLMGAITSHSTMATLEKGRLRYDLLKDLTPVAIVGSVPLVFVTHPSVPATSLQQLIDYAKSKPGHLSYASSGAGAPQRMAAELFKRQAGIDMLHVPYKGSGPAMTDLVELPEVKEQLLTQGVYTLPPLTPDKAAERLRAEVSRWAKVIGDSNIKADD